MLVRRGDRCYWYESERVGGRVRRVFVCAGEDALAASRRKDEERLLQQAARDEALLEEQRHEEALARLEDFSRLLDVAMAAELTRLGYRRHDRGRWRLKRRGSQEDQGVPGRVEADPRAGGQG
jgi:hypothetical protein